MLKPQLVSSLGLTALLMVGGIPISGAAPVLATGLAAPSGVRAADRANPQGPNLSSGKTIKTIKLQPLAVTLTNPVSPSKKTKPQPNLPVSISALDAQGKPITSGEFTHPIKVTIYGPAHPVLTAHNRTITSPTSYIYFSYNGRYFVNSMIVTAVSGHAFAIMAFQPKHRGFPGTQSVTFNVPNTNNRNFKRGWDFTASIGGGRSHSVQMDTGSRGIVVPASILGPSAIGPGPKAQIEYTSSGKIFLGHDYLAPVKLSFGSVSVVTVPIQVLGVEKSACAPGYSNCKPGKISGLGLIGVGFGRSETTASLPPELNNVFLSLSAIIKGSMHPGYIVTTNSVMLGITRRNEAGYKQIKLQPKAGTPGDWSTEPGCFGFPKISGYGAICGHMLVDTGIRYMILGLPVAQRPARIAKRLIPNGVRIAIHAPKSTGSAMSSAFTVGDGAPATPPYVRWTNDKQALFNTGRNLIAKFRYLFDAGSGQVGFKR